MGQDDLASKREFLGLDFDGLDTEGALAWIAARSAESPFAYVITPNVDHMVRLTQLGRDLRRAYTHADLCLCDSRVLARLGRMVNVDLPVAPGSDITKALFETGLEAGDTICLIGGTPAHAARLAELYPRLTIVQHVPPMGLLHDPAARAAAIDAAAAASARVTLIAVGSPQQELIAFEMRRSGKVHGTALCIGASVDFLVGNEKRAPRVVQKAGMEWAWRLASNPRRLAKRYLVDGPAIFPLVWRWAKKRRRT
ncbi:WecB/TagA/CpsF family glycosyltransferase [Sphingomonas sp. AP4-R1]|uniref:WecB/TagA/CpsF family glycosyltransferase n=1 Tax=Sphingomonas sp. AP4-R1 TaxID=2735134 RepID=UPI001493DB86|nr:WecB/TagA/CpsF family glycosyltransferase [Sphingomonas sp. AP4-R1]QJU56450.1 WecB/TagA/CpsF family glycosyltransferase [Sphingomonas sp. AP4-R1]